MRTIGQTGLAAMTGNSTPRHRLVLFVLGSLVLHTALFAIALDTFSSVHEPPGSQNLSVILAGPHATAVKPQSTPAAPGSRNTVRDSKEPVKAAQMQRAPQDAEESVGQAASQAQRREHLLGRVQTVLSRFLTYPPLAQRRGWEGRVILVFSLTTSGGIDDIALGQSSGYPTLDEAALAALNLARRHIQLAEHLSLVGNRLRLPVVYRLTES